MRRYLPDEAATIAFGREFLGRLPTDLAGWTILLNGELGAGKSTFARAFIRAAGHQGAVPSPTYTLVEPYEFPNYTIYHIDLYRIESADELEFLGWTDMEDGLKLIEWPERVLHLGRKADIRIKLRYAGDGRTAELEALSERGAAVLDAAGRLLT